MALQGLNPEAAWVPEPIPNHLDPIRNEGTKVKQGQTINKIWPKINKLWNRAAKATGSLAPSAPAKVLPPAAREGMGLGSDHITSTHVHTTQGIIRIQISTDWEIILNHIHVLHLPYLAAKNLADMRSSTQDWPVHSWDLTLPYEMARLRESTPDCNILRPQSLWNCTWTLQMSKCPRITQKYIETHRNMVRSGWKKREATIDNRTNL